MTIIRLTFSAGRYHATPWGRHVNEGVTEWPPSPYRLLRSLFDVWQRKCFDLAANRVDALLQQLASSPPRFHLPEASATHTRSYLSANSKDPTDKNLVFDAFLVFNRRHACYLSWQDLEMTTDARDLLERLLRNLNFLGRSESWVEAKLVNEIPSNTIVCDVPERASFAGELVSVACAAAASGYAAQKPWLEALTYSTYDLLKERSSAPPLLDQVSYVRPDSAISSDPIRRSVRSLPNIQAVVLSFDATVLPLVTTTIEVAEQIRTRLMGASKLRNGPDHVSPVFSGKSESGEKRLDHGHVYILPLASRHKQKQGRIDRVLILNPLRAFTSRELDAIRGVRELWQRAGRPTVRCVVTWQGESAASPERNFSRTVVSVTPFVPPHHWRKGRDHEEFLKEQVRRECEHHRVGASPIEIEMATITGPFDAIEFRRNRKEDPVRPGYALRLKFAELVAVPFAIGYGAHFGLGQFDTEPA